MTGRPIRVFLGSGVRQRVEEAVMVRSVLAHATGDVRIDVIDGDAHCTRDAVTGRETPLPDAWRGRIEGHTPFSFARFAPPALCGFVGRAIYCESDMLALGDIAELWEYPLDGAPFAAVPHAAHRGAASSFQTEGYMSSVMLFDAARCRNLDVVAITDRLGDGRLEYQDVISLTDRFLTEVDIDISPLPAMWNDLEQPLDDTKILHFTNWNRRPWLHPRQPARGVWADVYLACVRDGELSEEQLRTARRAGDISASVAWLPRIPPRCRGPVDRTWQQLELASTRVSHLLRATRTQARRVSRRGRRLLNSQRPILRRRP